MSYSTLPHRVGGRFYNFVRVRWSRDSAELFLLFWRVLPRLFRAFSRLHLVDFSVVFSFKFDFYSEIKCVQSRAGKLVKIRISKTQQMHGYVLIESIFIFVKDVLCPMPIAYSTVVGLF